MNSSPHSTASRAIKVACIGDSITSGHKLDNPGRDALSSISARNPIEDRGTIP
ncbi:MAG: hypothetical protein IJQ73_09065 [Kiritimatiellae bacterium]|nr:hypothetical protein [Kiritimatiellia bacterium]